MATGLVAAWRARYRCVVPDEVIDGLDAAEWALASYGAAGRSVHRIGPEGITVELAGGEQPHRSRTTLLPGRHQRRRDGDRDCIDAWVDGLLLRMASAS